MRQVQLVRSTGPSSRSCLFEVQAGSFFSDSSVAGSSTVYLSENVDVRIQKTHIDPHDLGVR